MNDLTDIVPTSFYRQEEERPSADCVGELIEVLKRLPPDLLLSEPHEVTVYNISLDNPQVRIDEVW